MVTRAVLRYARISPRKVRPVIDLIKGKRPDEAIAILFSIKKKASEYLIDLLRSAMANTKNMQGIDIPSLRISNIIASGGPQMKRFRAGSMGRASQIRKRTSHITVILDHAAPSPAKAGDGSIEDKKSAAAPVKRKIESRAANAAVAKKVKTKGSPKQESGKKGKE